MELICETRKGIIMDRREIPRINTLQIHYFLEVVESGGFTNAAKHLYATQSTLSKNILSLEEQLGVKLFTRSHKRLILTAAGDHLYRKWKALLFEMDHSLEESRALQGGYIHMLMIGILDSHDPEKFAMQSIKELKKKKPETAVVIQTSSSQEARQQVLSGSLDIAFTVLYDIEQISIDELDKLEIATCPHNVCMLNTNPLAKKEYLEISDLKDSGFVSVSPLYTPSYNGMIVDLCAREGFRPDFVCYTNNAVALPYNLYSDNDIFICDKYFRGYVQSSDSALQFRPIVKTKSGITAIWRKQNSNPALKEYINILRTGRQPL